jgi:hypothetical protein
MNRLGLWVLTLLVLLVLLLLSSPLFVVDHHQSSGTPSLGQIKEVITKPVLPPTGLDQSKFGLIYWLGQINEVITDSLGQIKGVITKPVVPPTPLDQHKFGVVYWLGQIKDVTIESVRPPMATSANPRATPSAAAIATHVKE